MSKRSSSRSLSSSSSLSLSLSLSLFLLDLEDLDGFEAFLPGLLGCFTVGLADGHPFDLTGFLVIHIYTVGSAEGGLVSFACLGVGKYVGESVGVGTAVRAVTGHVGKEVGTL